MRILGIESSCDETAIAVVENGRKVLSNAIASSLARHQQFGGVVPEIAAREHVKIILPVVKKALEQADCGWQDIDAIAVTSGPGLVSSLLVGTTTAQSLAEVFQKLLIPTNHIAGHIYSNWLYSTDEVPSEPEFPVLVLTVSGGHNELVLVKNHHDFEILGETLDDAAGEAFDKVARILDLGFPGGPIISQKAEQGNVQAFDFPRSMLNRKDTFDFSFSGLKTAVLYAVQDLGTVTEQNICDLAASFQEAVCDILCGRVLQALEQHPDVKEVHLAGGVSANKRLRIMLQEKIQGRIFRHPLEFSYCTDNAAMIAGAAYFYHQKHQLKKYELQVNPGWELAK